MAGAEAYLRAKFHRDSSNRLATVHQRHRQTDRQPSDSVGRTVLQTVPKNGSPYAIGTDVLSCLFCLSVLSVTLVYCGQTVGWIKIKLGTEVGLGPGHTVLDEDPAVHGKGRRSPGPPTCENYGRRIA